MKSLHHLLRKKFSLLSFLFVCTFILANNFIQRENFFSFSEPAQKSSVNPEKPIFKKAKKNYERTNVSFITATSLEPSLISDKDDYAPGETATLTGSGFLPGEIVLMQVSHVDGTTPTGADHEPWEVTANENGNFETTWHVCEDDCVGATLKATADGGTSGLHAEVTFTDAAEKVTPRAGPVTGGTLVEIGGSSFGVGSYTVNFDGISSTTTPNRASSVKLDNVTTPVHVAGSVNVEIVGPNVASSSTIINGFTYVCRDPANIIFDESMGTVPGGASATATIADQETANRFDNDSYTMSGTADVRKTTESETTDYSWATGTGNIFITNTSGTYFQIDGINTSGQQNLVLSFGIFKSAIASNGSDLVVEVSDDGTIFTPLSFASLPTGDGTADWHYRIASGTIPATSNLRIKFRQTGTTTLYRIDDIRLVSSPPITDQPDNVTICAGSNTSFAVATTGTDLSYQWQVNTGSGFANISNGGVYSGALTANLTITGATAGMNSSQYRCLVTGGCSPATTSEAALLTVRSAFTSGAIPSTGETICNGGDPASIGSTTPASGGDGSIVYEWRADGSPIASSNSETFDPPSGLTTTTTYTRYAKDGTCNTTFTASTGSWIVIVYDAFTSGEIPSNGETICNGGDPASIGSTTAASGGDGSFVYEWRADGSPIASSNSATYDPPSGLTTTTTYTRWAKDGTCNTTFIQSTGSWVVTVTPPPTTSDPGEDQTICTSDVSATLDGNDPVIGTGTWSVVSGPSTASTQFGNVNLYNTTFTPDAGAGTYTLRWTISNPPCTDSYNDVDIVVEAPPTVTAANSCAGGDNVTFTQSGGTTGGTWEVSGGGTIVAATGVFTPTTAGCFTATYTTPSGGCSDTKSFVVFPAAPTITAPTNTCNAAFELPDVEEVNGFTIELKIGKYGDWLASPTVPTAAGCYPIKARYVLTDACGDNAAGTAPPAACDESNQVNVVIFPQATAPTIYNTCNTPIHVPQLPAVAGFATQYKYNDGAWTNNSNSPSTPGCYNIKRRYVLSSSCGSYPAQTAGPASCESSASQAVIFPDAPTLTPPSSTCDAAFTLPTVSPVTGFAVQFQINSGTWSSSPTMPTTPGCYTIRARYVLSVACGSTGTNVEGPYDDEDFEFNCAHSDPVYAVIFPAKPSAPVVSNTCDAVLIIPALTDFTGFTRQYSFDGGTNWGTLNVSSSATPGCFTMKTRYILTSGCGQNNPTGRTAPCGASDAGYAVIFPAAPVIESPANTCNAAFTLPNVDPLSGFTVEFNIDNIGWSSTPTVPTTSGCHTIQARYVLTSDCGDTDGGTPGGGDCGASNEVSVVIFPAKPTITAPNNSCNKAFDLPTVTAVSGFDVEYSINGGVWAKSPTIPTTPGCYNIMARYVLASDCGDTDAGAYSSGDCGASNTVYVVIFPAAPPAPTVNSGCGAIVVTPPTSVTGFNIQYSFNDGTDWGANTPPTADNCTGYKIRTRYVTAAICGTIAAGTASTDADCGQSPATTRVVDNTAPVVGSEFVSKTSLWPPNHKMVDIVLNATDNCALAGGYVKVISNEPENDLGDGNTLKDMDWSGANKTSDNPYTVEGLVTAGSDGKVHILLRAERSGVKALVTPDIGRIYTVYFTATDACGNTSTATLPNTVTVAHNITSPVTGNSFKIGTNVSLAGTFWDKPGNKHTANWLVDGTIVKGSIVAEPSGTKVGKATGIYKPTVAGVYKLRMNISDQNGITSYATTNGDYEAFLVAYDPTGGYTFGAGKFVSPASAQTYKPGMSGEVKFGFTSNYFKNATNPKGETELAFKVGSVEFNALNYDYLVVSGKKAIYKGLGKTIVDGVEQSGYSFVMTALDGKTSATSTGTDNIRIKIFNKNTGVIIYDSQPGASDDADPTTPVAEPKTEGNDIVVVSTTTATSVNNELTQSAQMEVTPDITKFNITVYPNPTEHQFTLVLYGTTNEKISLVVYDAVGRQVKKMERSDNLSSIKFGEDLKVGVYIVEVRQGDNRKTLKLLKQ